MLYSVETRTAPPASLLAPSPSASPNDLLTGAAYRARTLMAKVGAGVGEAQMAGMAAAVLATAEDPGFPAEVNTWIRRWYPTQTAWVTKVSATPEVHHPPPEDSMADGMIALYSCIAIVAVGLAAGAAYRWGGARRRKLAPSGAVSDTAKVASRPSKAPKSSTAKVAPAPPKAPK